MKRTYRDTALRNVRGSGREKDLERSGQAKKLVKRVLPVVKGPLLVNGDLHQHGTVETDGGRGRQNTPPSPPEWLNTLTPVKRDNTASKFTQRTEFVRKAETKNTINKES